MRAMRERRRIQLLTAAGVRWALRFVFGCQSSVVLVWSKNMTQNAMGEVEELVRGIARALVDEPSAVEVKSEERDESTLLKLRVAPQDLGKVIGKQGRTARSVRTVLGAVSMKLHHRYMLDILEEDEA